MYENNTFMKIPVIIPFYKDHVALSKAKDHLNSQTVPNEVYVHDNTKNNVLWTKAINYGLKKFCFSNSYEFVLVLNQDAYLAPNCLELLIKAMEDNPKCGIVTPVAFDVSGNNTWYGGLDAYPLGRHRILQKDFENTTETFHTPWANGACMLLRIKMIHEIGIFDENMKFICSDADYSFTARSRGWDVLVATGAKIEHSLGASAIKSSMDINLVKLADQIYFGEKWLSGDVYKRLAIEGSKLTRMFIADELRKSKNQLNFYKSK